ncbi:hypothetical protein [Myxococcus landrumensis]|uniref:Cytochrome c domain-containing protein n=1 Tax=Myxococcus landrumensis TaxID=2813577 RepID=A0ABX7NEF1_9BACT|nr:hypothetical protein [Myxococcus landrumus]QSQ17043.1 hypothetical protein JY572_13720 [Myxococcus landrumus]
MRGRKWMLVAGVVLAMGGGAVGCSDKDSGTTSGGPQDPPPPATFTQIYTTLIAARCMPCHTTPGGIGVVQGMLDMTTQAAAYVNLVNVPTAGSGCAGVGIRVVPGQPAMSILYQKVNLVDPAPCGAKMPLGGIPLTQAEVDMIASWISAGALNN